jgi:hypothetical protein
MVWYLCYGTGGPNEDWMTDPPDYSELPRRIKYQAVWERYKSFMLPYSVLPLLCAVSRLVCEACNQADWISYPPGPMALPRAYQSHSVNVPRVALSKCCSCKCTFFEGLVLTWCTCSISNSCYLWLQKLLDPFHVWGNNLFLNWDGYWWMCNGTLGMAF